MRESLRKLEEVNSEKHLALTDEMTQFYHLLSDLKKHIKYMFVGGFKGEFMGIILFIIGLLLAGFSIELGM